MSYSKLRGKIREIFKSNEKFSEAMGMNSASLSAKLNNKTIEIKRKILLNLIGFPVSVIPFTVTFLNGKKLAKKLKYWKINKYVLKYI